MQVLLQISTVNILLFFKEIIAMYLFFINFYVEDYCFFLPTFILSLILWTVLRSKVVYEL